MVKQLSVFLENSVGSLSHMTEVLDKAGIDMLAVSIADTTNFGIFRAIVNDADQAMTILRDAGYTVNLTPVLAIQVHDAPGSMNEVLHILLKNNISVEYLYSFMRQAKDKALLIFKVEHPESARTILAENGVQMLNQEQIANL